MTFKQKLFTTLTGAVAATATCTKGINAYTELTPEDQATIEDTLVREQVQRGLVEDFVRASNQFFAQNPSAPSAEELISDNSQLNGLLRELYKDGRIVGGLRGADAMALPVLPPSIMINRHTPLYTGSVVHEMDHYKYGIHSPTYIAEVVGIIRAVVEDSSTPALGEAIIREGDISYFVGMEYTVADLPYAIFAALRTDQFPGGFSEAEVRHFYERFSSLPPDQWNRAMVNFVSEMPLFGGMLEAFGVTKEELQTCYDRHPEYQEASREVADREYAEWSKEHPADKPEAKHTLDIVLKNFR